MTAHVVPTRPRGNPLTAMTWLERAEVFLRLASTKDPVNDRHAHEGALLSVRTCRVMAIEEGEATREEVDALMSRDGLRAIERAEE